MASVKSLILLAEGVKYVSAEILPEIAAFFKAKSAQGVAVIEAQEELDSILFDDDMSDDQKKAAIRVEAGAALAEMNSVVGSVKSRMS